MDVRDLPALNAILNASAARAPRDRLRADSPAEDRSASERDDRRLRRIGAVSDQLSDLSRAGRIGAIQKTGAIRTVYSRHPVDATVLAALVPFLAIITLHRGLEGRYDPAPAHRKVDTADLAVRERTGVIVYWMLYQL